MRVTRPARATSRKRRVRVLRNTKAYVRLRERGFASATRVASWKRLFEAEDLAGLRDVGDQRVVAQMLAMMRIETPERPLHFGPGADDGAIDVERQPRHPALGEGLDDEIVIEIGRAHV